MRSWTVFRITLDTRVADVGKLWFAWFSTHESAVQTVQRYEASLKGAIRRELGSLTLAELTNGGVRRFIRDIADAGHVSEARNSMVVIRHLLASAIESGIEKPELLIFDDF
jgi:hypothetical protein